LSSDEDILDIIERASRSVVHVNTVRVVRDFYYRTMPLRGSGSGFIIDRQGLGITNAHVVSRVQRIGVVLHNNELLEGEVKGKCGAVDTALINIQGGQLQEASLGDSDKLRVGQIVYAIGNPFGLEGGPTVTSGVISALNRSIHRKEQHSTNLVQTDAAINPGNSGGPLIDEEGKVIAVNTAIIPYAQGIGFAVPINDVKDCVEQLKSHGHYLTPYIGVNGLTVTPQIASYYNLPVKKGFLVTNVIPQSPADDAELSPGDVIINLDGADINLADDLKKEIIRRRIGDRVKLNTVRGRQSMTVELIIKGSK
jgi:serine protease Do